jgi:hypothetical protein
MTRMSSLPVFTAFIDPSSRDDDDTVPSGRGMTALQARWLVDQGFAEWVTKPHVPEDTQSRRRWEWRIRDTYDGCLTLSKEEKSLSCR